MPATSRNPVLALFFGETVRALREAKEIAQEAEMDRSYLGKVERGEKQPSLDIVFRLSRVLGIALADLVDAVSRRLPSVRSRWNAANAKRPV